MAIRPREAHKGWDLFGTSHGSVLAYWKLLLLETLNDPVIDLLAV